MASCTASSGSPADIAFGVLPYDFAAAEHGLYHVTATGGYCRSREPAKATCGTTCAIIIGCVVGGCALIALAVVLWCCLASKRKMEKKEGDAPQELGCSSAADEQHKAAATGAVERHSESAVHWDQSMSTFPSSLNPLAPEAAPAAFMADGLPSSTHGGASVDAEDKAVVTRRVPTAEDDVTRFRRLSSISSATAATSTSTATSRRCTVRSKAKTRRNTVDAAMCPSDSHDSMEDLMVASQPVRAE
ncbi:hypothetical protein NESM_000877900 [Novymonas esmeraldas]|uniref:Uncharacterized protein n=1 Tax=Novymonas esmeraldas TaxID=1808958 RepID=A0AAW0EZ42_9TRYP